MRASKEGSISESVTGGDPPFLSLDFVSVRLVPGSLERTASDGAIDHSAGGLTFVHEITGSCLRIPFFKRPPTDSVGTDPGV